MRAIKPLSFLLAMFFVIGMVQSLALAGECSHGCEGRCCKVQNGSLHGPGQSHHNCCQPAAASCRTDRRAVMDRDVTVNRAPSAQPLQINRTLMADPASAPPGPAIQSIPAASDLSLRHKSPPTFLTTQALLI